MQAGTRVLHRALVGIPALLLGARGPIVKMASKIMVLKVVSHCQLQGGMIYYAVTSHKETPAQGQHRSAR